MKLIDCKNNLCGKELHLIFGEAVLIVVKYSVQFATLDEWHDEVEAHFCLEEILHSTEERMVELEKDIFFEPDLVDDFLVNNLVFPD